MQKQSPLDQHSSFWAIDRTLSGITILGQSGPGSNGSEGLLHISQSSSITWISPSDCLVSYPGHSLGESYTSAEIQLVYSTAPADWLHVCVYFVSVCLTHKSTWCNGLNDLSSKSWTELNLAYMREVLLLQE